jgi:hypothetical protein
MNPVLLGGAAVLAYLIASGSTSAGAGNATMYFRDYAWVTFLPAGLSSVAVIPGQDSSTRTNLVLPAPPGVTPSAGAWHVYAGGNMIASDGTPITVFPTAAGTDLYMWVPVVQNWSASGSTGSATQINGYWVTTASWTLIEGTMDVEVQQGVANIPDPPGESGGQWLMKHPGYVVYVTPSNANEADAQALSEAFSVSAASASGWFGGPSDFGGGMPPPHPGPTWAGGGFYQPLAFG